MARPKGSKTKSNGKSRGRKSKAEDVTGAKENAVEMRKGELELGESVVIDDGDFDLHFRAAKSATERMKTAKNLYDGCCKAAKKVSPDLLAAVKKALKFDGMDREDIKREMEIAGYVLRKTSSSVQLTIHDALLGDVKEQAYERGRAMGERGLTLNNPYPDGSDLAGECARGWQDGTMGNLPVSDEAKADLLSDKPAGEGHNSLESYMDELTA